MEKRIYPYLIKSKSMAGYYELLFDEGFELKIFDKKKDKELYDFFLPTVNNYMFWTFNLTDVKGFNQMQNDLKAPVCSDYDCNIFVKGEDEVISLVSICMNMKNPMSSFLLIGFLIRVDSLMLLLELQQP